MSAPLEILVDRWRAHHFPTGRWAVPGAARAFALAGLVRHGSGPLLVVVSSERDAEDLVDDLSLFTSSALLLPAWETLPFEHMSPNAATMARRAEARHRAASSRLAWASIVSSCRLFMMRIPSVALSRSQC